MALMSYYRAVLQHKFLQINCHRLFSGSSQWLYRKRNTDEYKDVSRMSSQELETLQDTSADKTYEEVQREEDQLRRKIAFKTMERKYHKKSQEVNLLTWDAKEQMRYLNQTEPETWTVQKLAESFPISEEGVVKILKSTFKPRHIEDIISHDERVQKRWKALASEDPSLSRPLSSRYIDSESRQKMQKLLQAGGNPTLPIPQLLLPDPDQYLPDTSGTLAKIVKDYCEQKAQRHEKSTSSLEEWKSHNQQLLIECFSPENNITKIKSLKSTKPAASSTGDYQTMFKYKCDAFLKSNENEYQKASGQVRTEKHGPTGKKHLSEEKTKFVSAKKPLHRSPVSLRRQRQPQNYGNDDEIVDSSVSSSSSLESEKPEWFKEYQDPGFQNTVKLKSNLVDSATREFSKDPDFVDIDVDIGRLGYTEGYVYDEKRGYQYPFGKTDPKTANLPKDRIKQPSSGGVYNESKYYYDEDGEFLYKAP